MGLSYPQGQASTAAPKRDLPESSTCGERSLRLWRIVAADLQGFPRVTSLRLWPSDLRVNADQDTTSAHTRRLIVFVFGNTLLTMYSVPALPDPRGPISEILIERLQGSRGRSIPLPRVVGDVLDDDDVHLALYVCYELHYRGWAGVDAGWEWDPDLLRARAQLEAAFLRGLWSAVPTPRFSNPDAIVDDLRAVIDGANGPSLSAYAASEATLSHLRELAIHRSAYQLKEADPHTWAIPRLPAGAAKSALIGLQFDEYGNGEPGKSHAELFADTMRALDLDPTYGAYLGLVPGVTLATVNLLSMFGLHRAHVGACIGHLAVFEMTSVVPMGRYAQALRRVTGRNAGAAFYDVHVVADENHQHIAVDTMVPALLEQNPEYASDVLFGASTLVLLERRFAEHVLTAWTADAGSLRQRRSIRLAS